MQSSTWHSQKLKDFFRIILPAFALLATAGCNWTALLSVSSTGDQGDSNSTRPHLSTGGRFVVFESNAANLVAGDTNGVRDIFLHDTVTDTTTRVSVDDTGIQGNSDSFNASVSGDGRYVTFDSNASNLVANDTNGSKDVFLRDTVTGTNTRVSVDNAGNEGNGTSYYPQMSRDGRYIAFWSFASNLVANDTNNKMDIFLRDTVAGTTTRVSVDSAGNQANFGSQEPSISGDGRYVTFLSAATNLVPNDTNGVPDIFIHDTATGTTTRVNVDSAGNQGNNSNNYLRSSISGNGRYVAFDSNASNLVADDTNGVQDVFVRDTMTGTTTRVSVDSAGNQAVGSFGLYSYLGRSGISDDGRYIAFNSGASNLVASDTNGDFDVFVHDRANGTTSRVSLGSLGAEADNHSYSSTISPDGRYVAFDTFATNLVAEDTNGTEDIIIRATPEVTITSVIPDHLAIGATTPVTITGTNFLPGAIPYAGGALLTNIVIVDENTITVDITVQVDKPTGAKNVSVSLLGTGAGPGTGAAGICSNCIIFF